LSSSVSAASARPADAGRAADADRPAEPGRPGDTGRLAEPGTGVSGQAASAEEASRRAALPSAAAVPNTRSRQIATPTTSISRARAASPIET
jgi:hypothetical protein